MIKGMPTHFNGKILSFGVKQGIAAISCVRQVNEHDAMFRFDWTESFQSFGLHRQKLLFYGECKVRENSFIVFCHSLALCSSNPDLISGDV